MTGQYQKNILKDQERRQIKAGELVDYYWKYLRKPLRRDLLILHLLQSILSKFHLFQEETLTTQILQIDLNYLLVEKSLQMVFVSSMILMIRLQDLKHKLLLKQLTVNRKLNGEILRLTSVILNNQLFKIQFQSLIKN